MSWLDLFSFFSIFSKKEPPPPRGAIAFIGRATAPDTVEVEWPIRTFSINEQVHGKWDTPVKFLIVESTGAGPAGKSVYRAKRGIAGYLPKKAVDLGQSKIRMRSAVPGMLTPGQYYLCSFAEGTVGGMAGFGY